MEPKEALMVLVKATQKIKASCKKHQLWVEAVNVLARAIAPKIEPTTPFDGILKKDEA